MKLSDSQKMRDADSNAIHVRGIPSTLLMTNAAGHVARAAEELARNRSAVIFCGSGNNGGDGVAAALYLIRRGYEVRVLLVGSREKLSADTAEMTRRLTELGGTLEDFDPEEPDFEGKLSGAGVIIDAMYGIGLNSPLRGKGLEAARRINASGVPVVSADIASGVEADTGRIPGEAVHADLTVTFSMAKPGHVAEPGCTCCGKLRVVDIGIPQEELVSCSIETCAVTQEDVFLPKREAISHKSDYGKLLVIGGSVGYTGAPSICAQAALRCGSGLVSIGVPQSIYEITALKNLEAMPFPLPDEAGKLSYDALEPILAKLQTSDVAVLGCGIGRSETLSRFVPELIGKCHIPLVLDADGLHALSGSLNVLQEAACPVILTPHEGEFVRLGGMLSGDRQHDARDFARKNHCVLVLKGHRTVCAFPNGKAAVICAGNPGMAKGGSGDALAGCIGALIGQMPLERAVVTATWLHARAGDLAAERFGEYAMTVSDLIACLPQATCEIITK